MNLLLKLIALERSSCDQIDKSDLRFDRRKEIVNQMLERVQSLELKHEGTVFDQGKKNATELTNVLTKNDLAIQNSGTFLRSLISNITALADKESFLKYLTSFEFINPLFTIASNQVSLNFCDFLDFEFFVLF